MYNSSNHFIFWFSCIFVYTPVCGYEYCCFCFAMEKKFLRTKYVTKIFMSGYFGVVYLFLVFFSLHNGQLY